MNTVTRSFSFCAGHRLVGHMGKCRNLHGHNYTVTIEVYPINNMLNSLGMVVDFSELKSVVGEYLDRNFDHGFIYWSQDTELASLFESGILSKYKSFALDCNPTAENIANHLMRELRLAIHTKCGCYIQGITVQETDNCSAKAS